MRFVSVKMSMILKSLTVIIASPPRMPRFHDRRMHGMYHGIPVGHGRIDLTRQSKKNSNLLSYEVSFLGRRISLVLSKKKFDCLLGDFVLVCLGFRFSFRVQNLHLLRAKFRISSAEFQFSERRICIF